jgi:hypothetical protein
VPGRTIVSVPASTPAVNVMLWARLEPFRKVNVIGPVALIVVSAGAKASRSPGAELIVTATADLIVGLGVPEAPTQPATSSAAAANPLARDPRATT